jgi:hypothetical protein
VPEYLESVDIESLPELDSNERRAPRPAAPPA